MILPGFPTPIKSRARGFDPNTPIGTFTDGGYFAGIIRDNNKLYAILVAPKAQGETTSIRWKSTNTSAPVETHTLTNGPAATAAMMLAGDASVYPLAHWAGGLTINGFTDWYIPARDECELIYRNLKPNTAANADYGRELAPIAYNRDGNVPDASGDTMGINRNSDPTGSGYTMAVPTQTGVALFAAPSGAQRMVEDIVWTSTQGYSSGYAWTQNFASGGPQSCQAHNGSRAARAVRRVEV